VQLNETEGNGNGAAHGAWRPKLAGKRASTRSSGLNGDSMLRRSRSALQDQARWRERHDWKPRVRLR
jgi:hypothetical protein